MKDLCNIKPLFLNYIYELLYCFCFLHNFLRLNLAFCNLYAFLQKKYFLEILIKKKKRYKHEQSNGTPVSNGETAEL
jgi:hypothetical protein